MHNALHAVMRYLGLLASLLLLQCGPKQAEDDDSGPGSGDTTIAASDTSDSTSTTDPVTTAPTSTTTEPTTTTGADCVPPNDANGWVCECTTNLGPWTPFNEACGREPTAPTEWTEWLCENYADEETDSATSGAGSTAGGESASATVADTGADTGETADDTGSLGCECTCRVTPACCDDSLP
jgi:hypothetical protein